MIYNAGAVLSGFGAAGFDLSAVRFAALATNRQDGPYLYAFVRVALRCALVAGSSAGLIMTAYLLASGVLDLQLLAIAAAITLFWALARVVAGLMRGAGMLSSALLSDRVTRDVFLLALAGIASLTAWNLRAELMLFTLLAGTVIGFAFGSWLSARTVRRLCAQPAAILARLDKAVHRDWIKVSVGLMAYNLAELLSSRFDIFVLSLLDSKEAVGALGLSLLLINLVTIPAAFLSLLIMPQVAVAYEQRDKARLWRLFKLTSIASGAMGIALATVIIVMLPYARGMLPPALSSELRWELLSGAIVFRSLCLIGSFPPILLMMSGHHKALIGAHLTGVAVRIGIYIACAAFIDPNLAIMAFVAGTMVVTALNLWQALKQLRGDEFTAGDKAASQIHGI